ADAVHDLRLVRLQVPDEVPAERIPVDRVLALEILGSVLAYHLDPGLDQHGHRVELHVLRGSDDGHRGAGFGPHLLVSRPDALRGHDSSFRARRSSSSRSFRAGSVRTSSSSTLSARPSSGPSEKPISIRSLPSTARSRIRCGAACSRSNATCRCATASRSESGTFFAARSARLSWASSNASSSPDAERNRRTRSPLHVPSTRNECAPTSATTRLRSSVG